MLSRRVFALALLAAACAPASPTTPAAPADESAAPAASSTLYLVRHAEKEIRPEDPNPPLTAAGQARAAGLVHALEGAPLDAVLSTPLTRTRDTVAPVARARGLEIEELPAGDLEAWVARLQSPPGQRVLVAGHSNTLPAIMEGLGVSKISIADGDYGELFVITLTGELATLERRRFGDAEVEALAAETSSPEPE